MCGFYDQNPCGIAHGAPFPEVPTENFVHLVFALVDFQSLPIIFASFERVLLLKRGAPWSTDTHKGEMC